ncbi:MAG: type II toxin-antitoxin system VapC family toxin [Rhodospirillaceae bacterium]|nr:type II toxin-antitoxin system VapC family toxin [Rhodospirillaceae bacterium]
MVIDSSALVAILQNEPEKPGFLRAIDLSAVRLMSVASLVEATIVIESRKGPAGRKAIDTFVARAGFDIRPVDLKQGDIARDAYQKYGRGQHPAGLNFGDCFAYALSVATGEPLLFKGTDFAKTDAAVAELPSADA